VIALLVWLGCCILGFPVLPLAFVVGLLAGIVTAVVLTARGKPEYLARREAWANSWYCNRCGAKFIPAPPSPSPLPETSPAS
jgi:Flp pilus assembly protein protease CpaA